MITKTKSGKYKVRFRVNPSLFLYFKRREINKSLDTEVYAVANAKADIIRSKYIELLKVSRILEEKQIQELVNKFIIDTLEQDLIDRARTGQGTVFTTVDKDDVYRATPALASSDMCDSLKSDYLEDLSNNNYNRISSTVDSLLEDNSMSIDKNSDNYSLLNYYMMLAQIQILDEASKRGRGHPPTQPNEIISKIFGNTSVPSLNQKGTDCNTDTSVIKLANVSDALTKYIKYYTQEATSKETSTSQIAEVTRFLNNIFIPIVGADTSMSMITLEEIIDFKDTLSQFPPRKVKPYNTYSTLEIANLIHKNGIGNDVKRIGKSTVNKYLSYTKAFFEYCKNTGLIEVNPMALIGTSRGGANALEERHPLDKTEIAKLLEITKETPIINNAVKVLYTSGMRLSELYKFKVNKVNDVIVYDLTDREIKLKNKPSYRIIPIHRSIDMELLKQLPSQPILSRAINGIIREQISEDSRKVLYSLRHSFASHLKNNKVEPTVISELMGHSHQTMTLQRYASSYDVEILKEAIDTLGNM